MIADLRFALRMLVKTPGFSVVAFLAIALGIGVNTTIFGVVNSLLLRPLPVANPERLVQMYTSDARIGRQPNSYLNFVDYRTQNNVFSGLVAYQFTPMGLTIGGETTNIFALMVSGNYFSMLGVQPALGRAFVPDEDTTPNANPVIVLSHRFWKKLGGDPSVVGSVLTLNGRSFSVIGVAPAKFGGTDVGVTPDLWVPIAMREWVLPADDWYQNRRALMLNVFGRLKPGVSITQAEAQLQTVARQLEEAYPDTNKGRFVSLLPLEQAKTQGIGGPANSNGIRDVSVLLMAAAGSLLLIACANVANLLLARGTTRQREIAIRLALGAQRGRIVRQLLTESLMLAFAGGLGGVVLAYWLGDLLLSQLPASPVPLILDPQPDARVLVFAFALAVLSGVTFGLAPAWQTSRSSLTESLRERVGTATHVSRFNLRNILVVAQIAGSLLLLVGSGLFLKAFHRAQAIRPGFRTDRVALLSFDLTLAGYDKPRAKQALRSILEDVRRDSDVRSADFAQTVPFGFGGVSRTILAEGSSEAEGNQKFAAVNEITPTYFSTMAIPLVKGRTFAERDTESPVPRVAIISEAMAREFWPGEEAIGRRFRFFQSDAIEVIGVVQNVKLYSLGEAPTWMVYLPMHTQPQGGATLVIHTAGVPGPALAEAQRIVRRLDTHIPITYAKTMTDHLALALWPSWMGAVLLGSFGMLALVLASMGVYGVMAYSVSQRTRELGIRMALGAQAHQVLGLVVRQGMTLAVIGLCIGLLAAVGSTRLVAALLYGVNPNDPIVFAGVTLLLALAAFAACYLPARRALKIDPVVALRFD
ncbi:MAG: ABC transporter permease [Chthoniobacterales bacterium]|nr:ABC transporter permease [Chthoniobacterales bacterium]